MINMGTLTTTATIMAGIGFMSQYVPILNIFIILMKVCGLSTFRVRKDRDKIKGLLKVLDSETGPGTGTETGAEQAQLIVAVKLFKGGKTSDGLPEDEMKAAQAAGGHPCSFRGG